MDSLEDIFRKLEYPLAEEGDFVYVSEEIKNKKMAWIEEYLFYLEILGNDSAEHVREAYERCLLLQETHLPALSVPIALVFDYLWDELLNHVSEHQQVVVQQLLGIILGMNQETIEALFEDAALEKVRELRQRVFLTIQSN